MDNKSKVKVDKSRDTVCLADGEASKEVVMKQLNLVNDFSDKKRLDQDSQTIQSILPAIIWTERSFADHLTDNQDTFENLINSSPYFRELLKDKRVLLLSKKVFKIFRVWCTHPTDSSKHTHMTLIRKVLKWRLVCRSWCSSFDQLLKEEQLYNLKRKYDFRKTDLLKFVKHFEHSHSPEMPNGRSPFIVGYLHILLCLEPVDEQEIGPGECLSLFRMYGNHVCDLGLTGLSVLHQQNYLTLRQLLMLTPNLQSLEIFFDRPDDGANVTKAFTQINPLPKFVNLKTLNLTEAPPAIFSSLVHQNDQILNLKATAGKHKYDLNLKLESLERLYLEMGSDVITNVVRFVPSVLASWPLKSLIWEDYNPIRWSERFQMIADCWGSTLETLRYSPPYLTSDTDDARMIAIVNDSLNCRLNLPKVKCLMFEPMNKSCSLDFILGMSALESVTIYSRGGNSNGYGKGHKAALLNAEKNQIVKWIGYEDRFGEESNIWTLFENLKYLNVYYVKYRCNVGFN